ncbi:hypothetical protein Hanom_Chr02g00160611 [Helianthus anomalus]
MDHPSYAPSPLDPPLATIFLNSSKLTHPTDLIISYTHTSRYGPCHTSLFLLLNKTHTLTRTLQTFSLHIVIVSDWSCRFLMGSKLSVSICGAEEVEW